MSLASYVENLRERPEHHRRRHAFWWSFGFTALVFVFWVASFTDIGIGTGASSMANSSKKFSVAAAEEVISPGASLIAGVGAFAGDVWEMIVGPKKVEFAEVQVSPGKR